MTEPKPEDMTKLTSDEIADGLYRTAKPHGDAESYIVEAARRIRRMDDLQRKADAWDRHQALEDHRRSR